MQDVMSIDFTVVGCFYKRHILIRLGFSQSLGRRKRRLAILSQQFFPVFRKLRIIGIDTIKDSGINRLQHHILSLLFLLRQALHGRSQRIGGYLCLHLRTIECCFQQHSIVLPLSGFLLNSRQMGNHGLRKIFLFSFLYFVPQLVVTLSKHPHRHEY